MKPFHQCMHSRNSKRTPNVGQLIYDIRGYNLRHNRHSPGPQIVYNPGRNQNFEAVKTSVNSKWIRKNMVHLNIRILFSANKKRAIKPSKYIQKT